MSASSSKFKRKISRDSGWNVTHRRFFRACHRVRVYPVSNFLFVLHNIAYRSQPDLFVHMIATNVTAAYLLYIDKS